MRQWCSRSHTNGCTRLLAKMMSPANSRGCWRPPRGRGLTCTLTAPRPHHQIRPLERCKSLWLQSLGHKTWLFQYLNSSQAWGTVLRRLHPLSSKTWGTVMASSRVSAFRCRGIYVHRGPQYRDSIWAPWYSIFYHRAPYVPLTIHQ